MEAGKILAAKNLLGIDPKDFDEFDPKHKMAQNAAVMEIRERARQIYQNMTVQQMQQARAQQAVQAKAAELSSMVAEVRSKTPDFDEISNTFFPRWREGLTVKENTAVEETFRSGDTQKIKGVLEKVIADYRAGKAPQVRAETPPVVVGAGNAGTETRGMVDISNFGDMSADEQANWLITHKYAV